MATTATATEAPASKLEIDFTKARKVSTPLIGITTPDQAVTIELLKHAIKAGVWVWDCVTGIKPANEIAAHEPSLGDPMSPIEMLATIVKLPADGVVFAMNFHRFLDNPAVVQGVWNLREPFKLNGRTLVMLSPALTLPAEIEGDVIMFDEPLPSQDQIRGIIAKQFDNAGLKAPAVDVLDKSTDALTGLPAFAVEQIAAMSLTKAGIKVDALWERKRQAIEQTPGLSVWRGGETFDDIGGCENVKRFMTRVIAGEQAPRGIVFVDEIEKQMAGSTGDSSGTSQRQLGKLLSYMQDHNATGVILIGPPGAAKSMIAKATGNTAGVPTIALDFGDMQDKLVGASEQRTAQALKVITSVTQGRALFIATCNSIAILPPELRRRFTFGTFFFDLPDTDEREAIWKIYGARYGVDVKPASRPDDNGWTGAEIKQCCELAWRLKTTIQDAAGYVVPVAVSAADQIDKLRQQATGKFISASRPGVYSHRPHAEAPKPGGRKIEV